MMRRYLLTFMMLTLLPGCAGVPRADFAPDPDIPVDAHPAPVMLTNVKYRLPTGSDIGATGSGLCVLKDRAGRDALDGSINRSDLREVFHDTLAALGYDVAGGARLLFDEDIDDDVLRAEYRVGAEIIGADADFCYREAYGGFLGTTRRSGVTGALYLKIRWHVYDGLRRATVLKLVTDGYAMRRVPNTEGEALLINSAFEMAAHNLGADPAFRDLMVYGLRPANPRRYRYEARPRQFDSAADVVIHTPPLSRTPFSAHADTSRRAAVMVQAGAGHGSGFFIGDGGHILTNSHVVGNALHVRVVMADRQEALPAEVMRVDRARDVALLRLSEPVDPSDRAVLPIRADWPRVGETVYAIGAPRNARLQDSVTSGIVSAHRRHYKILGTVQDFIQSDVTIHGGNSGGPLLDAHGNIVGLAVAGMASSDDNNMGLNYFIPIGEALNAVRVDRR